MGRLRQAVAKRAEDALGAYTERHASPDGDSVDLGTPLRGAVVTVLVVAAGLGKDTGSGQDGDH